MSKECDCHSCHEEMIICQSCAMPLAEDELFGTEKDGSKNKEYCIYCYKEGAFTDPTATLETMIEIAAPYLAKEHNLSLEKAKEIMLEATRDLKRWRKK